MTVTTSIESPSTSTRYHSSGHDRGQAGGEDELYRKMYSIGQQSSDTLGTGHLGHPSHFRVTTTSSVNDVSISEPSVMSMSMRSLGLPGHLTRSSGKQQEHQYFELVYPQSAHDL